MNDESEQVEGRNERYEEAKAYVGKQKALISYLGVYVVVNAIMVVVWALSGGGYPWFVWTLLGMAVPIFFLVLDLVSARYGKSWEERKIRQYMGKDESPAETNSEPGSGA